MACDARSYADNRGRATGGLTYPNGMVIASMSPRMRASVIGDAPNIANAKPLAGDPKLACDTKMDPLIYAAGLFALLICIEALLITRRRDYSGKDTAANLACGLGNLAMALAASGATVELLYLVRRLAIFHFPMTRWTFLAALVLEDLTVYWHHRAHHAVRILWATHVVHHSSKHYNLSTAVRQSIFSPLTEPIFYLPMALLGFDPLMIVSAQTVNLLYGFCVHTEMIDSVTLLDYLFVTPSHHRVHHGCNPQYIDRNYGGVLILWDRLFGTFRQEAAKIEYGLTDEVSGHNPLMINLQEWRRLGHDVRNARGWSDRIGYLFRSPGWRSEARWQT